MHDNSFVSIVFPLTTFNEAAERSIVLASQLISEQYEDYEIILVDDHLDLRSEAKLTDLTEKHHNFRNIRHGRSYGPEASVVTGINHAIGNYVVVFHPEQDPVVAIPEIISFCKLRADIVYGVDKSQRKRVGFSGYLSDIYYWYLSRFTDLRIPRYHTGLLCLSRRAASSFKRLNHTSGKLVFSSSLSNLKSCSFHYKVIKRTEPSVVDAIGLATDTVLENSVHPLKLLLSASRGLIGIAGILFLFLSWQITTIPHENVFFPMFMGALSVVLLFSVCMLVLLAEYMLRLFLLLRPNSSNIVEKDRRSSIMLNPDRLNVIIERASND
ncbi:glycosyltransferase [Pseudovibrio japonicus]|uniref:glycosyltransferase n=1 Tax=Pseudovibrio japonicus TaxID=366534 RepID=UPI00167404A0|nr:glycosyltransferase [Pseudovibrio japonicus]